MTNQHLAHLQVVEAASRSKNECRDCAVRATALVTGVEYDEVHSLFKSLGRKDRHCTLDSLTEDGIKRLGFDLKFAEFYSKVKTIRSLEKVIDDEGIYLVKVRRHMFCIKGGLTLDSDSYGGRLSRIISVYEVVKKA